MPITHSDTPDQACNRCRFILIVRHRGFDARIDGGSDGYGGIGMTTPPRHPRFERAAAALRENLKRRKAKSRARVAGGEMPDKSEQAQPSPKQNGQEEK